MMVPRTDLLEGRRLGDFVIGREIGRGGMGVVYEAQQVSLNRRVALKVLFATIATPNAAHRFQREAEAAAKLHHTNIVPVYATGEQEGTRFYAMELIEGPSLDRVIRHLRSDSRLAVSTPSALTATAPFAESSTPSPSSIGLSGSTTSSAGAYFDAVAQAVAEVADALDYAHREGVIHRDIKPSNLLLSPSGRLSVNDFGLARMLEQPGMTITGEMVGTPMYMSPEQIASGRVPIDHRTDIYSLGATLYEMLTLEPPFSGQRRDQLLAQVIQKEPRPPRKVNPKVPVDLETICLKAMDKDPDRRYQTAGQMSDDLRRYVKRFAILARRASPLARVKKWVLRNRALSAALAGLLVCASVATGLVYRSHMAARERAAEQVRHEAKLLDEQRRSALDKAILLARVEDFDAARKAIREAEKLGCSAGQVRMLQGQLAFCKGETKEAIEHLTQATELVPDSVAAWSMLSAVLQQHGLNAESNRAMAEATRRPAITPEDYLFRGLAESSLDPERGLATLEEAVRQRPSALAHLLYCEALRLQVLAFPDVARATRAMDDIRLLKRQFPENAMVSSTSVLVHLTCWHVFHKLNRPELQQVAFDEGMNDARVLERFPDSARAVWSRLIFLDLTGQAVAIQPVQGPGIYVRALFHYRRAEFDEAVKLLEQLSGEGALDFFRVVAIAELSGGRDGANKLLEEITARKLNDWDLFNSQLILRFLGRKSDAIEVSRKMLADPSTFPPVRQEQFRRALEYCAERLSAQEFIALTGGHCGELCNAHLCIALTALADADRPTARKHFELAVETGYYEWFPFDLSRMLLSRMNQDPTWPPWIKAAR